MKNSISSPAESGKMGKTLTWSFTDGTLTVSGNGAMPDYSSSQYLWFCNITAVIIEDGVTNIGNCVFYCCYGLTSATIPASVTKIGASAFERCSSLTAITIPAGVTSIGDRAFYSCSKLASVNIPAGTTSIGYMAFFGCHGLTAFTVEKENSFYSSIDGVLFNKAGTVLIQYPKEKAGEHYDIPAGVTEIEAYAFPGGSSLKAVAIPDSVTAIGEAAFSGCDSLMSVTIPDSVASIGNSAFRWCHSLTSVTVPGSVTSIGWGAFHGCRGLTAVTIPGSVTRIEERTFSLCSSLTSVTIPDSVAGIGEKAFCKCNSLKDVTVGWMTPLPVEDSTFDGAPLSSCTLHVPAGTKALYEAADVWKDFGTVLEDADMSAETVPAAGVQVRMYGNLLSVDSPVAEQLEVYSTAGHLLYRVQKPAGPATFDPKGLPRGVLIVRGSSGWTGKIVR